MAAVSVAALALSACGGKTESSTKEAADDQIYTASFDCAKAGNDIERRICSNEQISSLDRSLSDLYKKAIVNEPDLRTSQRAWINERNKCSDNDCLVKSYWERISLLEKAAAEQATASKVSAESVARKAIEIPRLALQCGGGDYRNGRLVFSPDEGAIYKGSVIDEKMMKSSQIWNENGKIRAVMGKSHEIIIDPKNPTSYRENSNYSPNSEKEEQSCRRAIQEAKDDCAEAANFRQCMSIRHPQELSRDDGAYCSVMGSRWQEFECDIVDQDDYNNSLIEIKSYGSYNL